jgi:AbiV family abortive infection protein
VPQATEETITAPTARAYWRALVENVVSLIEDAALLLDQSPARARSLLILAQEETGKAQRLYVLAESAWTGGLPEVTLPKQFLELEGRHSQKMPHRWPTERSFSRSGATTRASRSSWT